MKKTDELTGKVIKDESALETLDLGSFETRTVSNAGVDYAIINPRTGEPSATVFTLLGKDSDEYLEYRDAVDREMQSKLILAVANTAKNATEAKADTASDLDMIIDELVVLTKGWRNVRWNGEELTFSKENARKIYRENAIVRAQVKRFTEDRSNFFPPASSPTSEN